MSSAALIRTRPAGLSILEVLIMATILGVCALCLGQTMMGAMHQTRTADEMRAASFAARTKLEHLLINTSVPDLVKGYGMAGDATDKIFPVTLNDTVPAITLPGPNGENAGEVFVFDKETIDPSTAGRDLDGDGVGDGVTMCPWPVDLDGDGTIGSTGLAKRVVVGVVIRWVSFTGAEQRYELWSMK